MKPQSQQKRLEERYGSTPKPVSTSWCLIPAPIALRAYYTPETLRVSA